MRRPRVRSFLDAAAVLISELALFVLFWRAAPLLGVVDYSHFGRWLELTPPGRALGALARLLGLAVSGWLLVTSVVYALAALSGKRGLLRGWRHLTLPVVRRVVDTLAVASVTASTIGTGAGTAFASTARLAPIVQPYQPGRLGASGAVVTTHAELAVATRDRNPPPSRTLIAGEGAASGSANHEAVKTLRPSTAIGRHLPHPGTLKHDLPPKRVVEPPPGVVPSAENGFAGLPKGTKVVVVQPGDCLSVIAEKYLGDWRLDTEIAALNYGRLQPDGLALVDDHWIYPGWVLIMPADAHATLVVSGAGPRHGVQGETSKERAGAPQEQRHEAANTARRGLWGRKGAKVEGRGSDEVGRLDKAGGRYGRQQATTPAKAGCADTVNDVSPAANPVQSVPRGSPPAQSPPAQSPPAQSPPAQSPPAQSDAAGHSASGTSHAAVAQAPGTHGASEVPTGPGGSGGAGGDVGPGVAHAIEKYDRAEELKLADGEAAAGQGHARRASHQHRELQDVELALAGLGALGAAGFVWMLQRARRDQAHTRRRGFLPAQNPPEVQAAERRARAVASEEAMCWVDLGVRYLGALIEQAAHDAGVAAILERRLAEVAVPADDGEQASALETTKDAWAPKSHGLGAVVGPGDQEGEDCWGHEDENQADAFERWWTSDEGAEVDATSALASKPRWDDVPSLVMVKVGTSGLEVALEPAPPGRLGWFVPRKLDGGSSDFPAVHLLAPDIGLEDLQALAAERWPACPALVAVGDSREGTVLVNLEHAGAVSVEGPGERVRGFLAGLLLQLATQPWAEEMLGGLYAVGESPLAGRLAQRVQHVPASGAMELAEKLDALASARLELAGEGSLSAVRSLTCEALPNVVVAFSGTPANALRCLAEAAVPERSGVVLVAAGPVEGTEWKVELSAGSQAVLRGKSGGDELVVQLVNGFRSEEVALLSEALSRPEGEGFIELKEAVSEQAAVASSSYDDPPVASGGGPAGGAGAAPVTGKDGGREPAKALGAGGVVEVPAVEIRFLGPVDVVGGDMDALSSSRIMAALGLLAYLAAHPRPISADELAGALWPLDATNDNFGGPQRKTVMNVVSRARSVLGYGVNGKERIVLTPRGYRLAGEVGSDWDRFRKHVSVAHGLGGSAEARDHLRAALELVRGEPFGGVLASQFFEWVTSEHLDMVISAQVVDVAEELGELALAAGDLGLVYWAVEKGLQIEPTREELFRLWMHALGQEGRPARVDDVYRRLKLVLRQRIHPLQEPQPASREVWRRYVAMEGATAR
jgi:DNA-binding SARP family transcriptional activator/nucleoid-associated protein YgaU